MTRRLAASATGLLVATLVLACADRETTAPIGEDGPRLSEHESDQTILTITDHDLGVDWDFVLESGGDGSGAFVDGPGEPPLGDGSAQLWLETATDGMALVGVVHAGTRIDEIEALSYATYREAGSAAWAASLQFNAVDDLNDPTFGRLVFEPANNADQGAIADEEWQVWDAIDAGEGRWWGTGGFGAECPNAAPFCTWDDVLEHFPDAALHPVFGGFVLKAGSGWGEFRGHVDAVSITIGGVTTTYDFEPQATCFVDLQRTVDEGPSVIESTQSIQEAVDLAEPGDHILVEGECDENVLVETNGLRIEGIDGALLTSSDPTAPAGGDRGNFRVRADEVTIEGFTLIGGHYGVRASGDHNVITNNKISDMAFRGILAGGVGISITDNVVTGGSRLGIQLGGSGGEASHNEVLDANRSGFMIRGTGHSVSHNTAVGNGRDGSDGIVIEGSGHTISHNTIAENGRLRAGVRQGSGLVIRADEVELAHIIVKDNFLNGIVILGDGNAVTQATVEGNAGTGVLVDEADRNTVNQSRLCENGELPETFDVHVVSGFGNAIRNSQVGDIEDDGDQTREHRIEDCD